MNKLVVTIIVGIVAALTSFEVVESVDSISLMMQLHRKPPLRQTRNSRQLTHKYMNQLVDNLNPNRTYEQAYFENDEFFDTDGPLFIFIGGEWAITSDVLLTGHMFDMAAEHKASMFYPEHRFYGNSYPTSDVTLESLKLLSVTQSLMDLANFIVQIKREQTRYANSKVILFGSSYSGSMVAWFRKLYPQLAVGGWASSAPILAISNFTEYKQIVGDSIGNIGGWDCYDRLESAFRQANKMIVENQLEEFRQMFGFCGDFGTHPLDVATAFSSLSNIMANIVQYHSNHDIQYMCEELQQDQTISDVAAFARLIRSRMQLDIYGCIGNYMAAIQSLRDTELDSYAVSSHSRQWMYQTCTEFGWFQTSGSKYQPFGSGFTVDLYYNMCRDIFGQHMTNEFIEAGIKRTNRKYGGWNLNVKRVYFTNGVLDPWRAVSVQYDLNKHSPADFIPGASHSSDLFSISEKDSLDMRQAKERVQMLVDYWLNGHN